MTEDEARMKWCPFARAANSMEDLSTSVNRQPAGEPDPDCMCIASDCMAWRMNEALGFAGGYCGMVP